MWDEKTGKNVTVAEASATTLPTTTTIAASIQSTTSIDTIPNIQEKDLLLDSTNCGQDSGFISGPQTQFQSVDDIDIKSTQNIDSSLIDIDNLESPQHLHDKSDISQFRSLTKDLTKSDSEMILDSGIDCNLPEWFCSMKIDGESPLNNLNCSGAEGGNLTKKQPTDQMNYAKFAKKRPLWEICYIQDDDGDTHLHLAIIGEYVQVVFAIIRLAPVAAVLDIRNDDAQAPIHLAVLTRQANIVRRLIVAGAKATVRDRNGNTPLHLACLNGDKACVEALTMPVTQEELKETFKHNKNRIPLLTQSSPVAVPPPTTTTTTIPQSPPLYPNYHHHNQHNNHHQHHQQQFLPVDLEQRNYDGEQCVHICAQRNDIDILRHLVKLGTDINAREGKSGYTALHFACENGNKPLVQFLLNECTKLNVETCTYGLWTAYQLASEQKNEDVMSELKSYGAELLTPPTSDDDGDYTDSYDEEEY